MLGAIALIVLAGLADGLGTQSVGLFVNKVTRRGFALNLLGVTLFAVVGALSWIGSIWLLAHYALGAPITPRELLPLVSRGYVPLLFTFLALVPYYGLGIAAVLHGASFAIVAAQLASALAIASWEALACAIGGWLLLQAARRLLSQPLAFIDGRLWVMTTRHAKRLSLEAILDQMPSLGPFVHEDRKP
jgi:hypothetical protein